MILVTGSAGLVGTALVAALRARGEDVRTLDLVESADVRDPCRVARQITGSRGVVHLAAVSRVAWAERDPTRCNAVNVLGTRNVAEAAQAAGAWMLHASSREVYGHTRGAVTEDATLGPCNVYGRSKLAGEQIVTESGGSVVRLSNVYGSVVDHHDRVVPAFASAALAGEPLHVEGAGNSFDFVHIEDVTRGLLALVDLLDSGARPSPVHLVTGVSTSLGELARLCVDLAGTGAPIVDAAPRTYDVAKFAGDPYRARELLGWEARVPVRDGLARLIRDIQLGTLSPSGRSPTATPVG